MKGNLYVSLAKTNIRKNSQTYLPYILACVGSIAMFFIMLSLNQNQSIMNTSATLSLILALGTIVIGFFAILFLFYTNSFLIKRRKKEFGLFNILGLEKIHLAAVMFLETLIVAAISLFSGIALGIVFSKLMELLLLRMLNFEVNLGFEISPIAINVTLLFFGIIFLLTLLNNLRHIHLANPVELLTGGQVGEREPKANWLIALLGLATLAGGYYIAQVVASPIDAIPMFFVAVILVIIGTYCLFISGSVAFLKLLKRNKSFYYQPRHFISVSGMIYRMKQNGAGLANICILSTIVLVMISSTICLFLGVEDSLHSRYPRDILVYAQHADAQLIADIDAYLSDCLQKYQLEAKNIQRYRDYSLVLALDERGFIAADSDLIAPSTAFVSLIPQGDYPLPQDDMPPLEQDELLFLSQMGQHFSDEISFGDLRFTIRPSATTEYAEGTISALLANHYQIVVPDEAAAIRIHAALGQTEALRTFFTYGFDVDLDEQSQIYLVQEIDTAVRSLSASARAEGPAPNRAEFYVLYGGLFFLGLFLGALFIMATVLIIYYKQITEGYEDKGRFEIMQKVGLSRDEVKRSIRSQVLTVFFLPLIGAGLHIIMAFHVISLMLSIFNLTNIRLFALSTLGSFLVFAVFYAIVYHFTARTYYRIVAA